MFLNSIGKCGVLSKSLNLVKHIYLPEYKGVYTQIRMFLVEWF
jgi:hypothetical protein